MELFLIKYNSTAGQWPETEKSISSEDEFVSFCNEIYEFCNLKDVNYENVRKLASIDSRIGSSHTNVPGHDGKKGFGGTCFPKDTASLKHEMEISGMTPYVINSIIERNEKIDRPEKDWFQNKGRATVD